MRGPRNNDEYTERELAEIEELNNLPPDHRSFFQSPWWGRIAIGFAALIVISLLFPFIGISCNSESGPSPSQAASTTPKPDFELAAAQGGLVSLSDTLEANDAVVIVFYRGHF
ncbi:MAG: hypothetical protein OXL97_04375 [Chloroflexota bacterium]|nr:hypothetical protein [Chloroflexota bacterium]MDE2884215.1 hypothetical protein [Chloroflexota bacterium]